MRFSTRRAPAALALALTAALLGACAPSSNGDSASTGNGGNGKVTLSVWSWRTEDATAYKEIFRKFTDEHPDISVEFKPYKNTEYNTILSTGLTESGGPDVAQLRAYGQLQPLIEAGDLVPLDGKVDLSGFDPTVVAGAKGKKDGKVYGVPFATQAMWIFYNKKIFADHGIEVPTTWAQMTAAADKLLKAGVTPFATTGKDAWMLPIVHDVFGATRYGGAEFEKAVLAGTKTFTDPDYVASIQVVKDLQKYFPKDVSGVAYTDAQVMFTTGKAAMYPGGSFELGFFQQQAPDMQLGVFSAPPAPGAKVSTPLVPSWADGSYGVNAKSPHQKEALELVKWMATKAFGQQVSDQLKQISPVPGVTVNDPVLAQMSAGAREHPAPYLLLVDFRYGQPLGTDLLGSGLQSLLLGQKDAATVAADLQKGVSQWFKPGA